MRVKCYDDLDLHAFGSWHGLGSEQRPPKGMGPSQCTEVLTNTRIAGNCHTKFGLRKQYEKALSSHVAILSSNTPLLARGPAKGAAHVSARHLIDQVNQEPCLLA